MISKIRHILSQGYRLSGIRGCMAAGAVTAGIAAFAVIGGASDGDASKLNLETDVIPEESAAVTEVHTEKRAYSRDIDYLYEDLKAAVEAEEQSKPDVSETVPETEAQTEAETEAYTEEAYDYGEETEEPSESDESEENSEEASNEAEEAPEDTQDITYEEESDNTEYVSEEASYYEESYTEQAEEQPEEAVSEEIVSEETVNEDESLENEITARSSAAWGDEGDSGLSSALDLEMSNESVSAEEIDYENANEESEENASSETAENLEAEEDTAIPDTISLEDDDDLSDIPEDITLDDEDENEAAESGETLTAVPQEGAISLFSLPEYLEFDENGIPTQYVNVLTGNACAYTAEPGALMSTGKEVFQGYVAVDPDIIPYGSELYIVAEDGEIYGYAIAADTGYSVCAGDIIVDLFMNEYDDCIQWGNKPVKIYVLK